MTLERAYYHCEACQGGFCPRDRALGMEGASLSPAVTRMVGLSAAMVSFQEAGELIGELAGVPVDAKQVERTAEDLGREIARNERSVVEPQPPCAPTMYLGMDGTAVPMRKSELVGREGKQADGSSKTREVKLVTVWSAEDRDDEGTPVRDAGSVPRDLPPSATGPMRLLTASGCALWSARPTLAIPAAVFAAASIVWLPRISRAFADAPLRSPRRAPGAGGLTPRRYCLVADQDLAF